MKVEVQTVLSVSKKVAEECSIKSVKDDVVETSTQDDQLVGNHVVANHSLLLIVVFWPP